MLDSDFWRDKAKEFRVLDPTGTGLSALWIQDIDDNGVPIDFTWALKPNGAIGTGVEGLFVPLATRAALRLSPRESANKISIDIWLDLVKDHRKPEVSLTGVGMSMGQRIQWERGSIDDVCNASAELCGQLEALYLDREKSTPVAPSAEDDIQEEALRQFRIKQRVAELEAYEATKRVTENRNTHHFPRTQETAKHESPVPHKVSLATDHRFPNRAKWLEGELIKRGWTANKLHGFGGPDHKSIKKMQEGSGVGPPVLRKTLTALNSHTQHNDLKYTDIPKD